MELLFDEVNHKYIFDTGESPTSVTTYIGQFEESFDTEFWSKFGALEKLIKSKLGSSKYKSLCASHKSKYGKEWRKVLLNKFYTNNKVKIDSLAEDIKRNWINETERACNLGNSKHKFFEDSIDESLGVNKSAGDGFIRLSTIKDVIANGAIGTQNFDNSNLIEYPQIYKRFNKYVKAGYTIFSEIAVCSKRYNIAGLIDVPIINFEKGTFIIDDWKTNKHPIHFNSGFYPKDDNGNKVLTEWIEWDKFMKYPLNNLKECSGTTYSLQLSIYAVLFEMMSGFKCRGLNLHHIVETTCPEAFEGYVNIKDIEYYKRYDIKYLKQDAIKILKLNA